MTVQQRPAVFGVVDIMATDRDEKTNSITATTGYVNEGTRLSSTAEHWQTPGVSSRPSRAVAGSSAAQGFVCKGSERDIILATRDVRSQAIYGTLSEGETCVHACGAAGDGGARVLLKGDGSVSVYTTTTGKDGSGDGIMLQVAKTGIIANTPWGQVSLTDAGFIVAHSSGNGIVVDASGVTINGKKFAATVQQTLLGLAATAATPAVVGPSGVAGIGSTSVFISPT